MTARPDSTWTPSPNFRSVAAGRPISAVIVHATATSGLSSPLAWLCNPDSKVSAHYLIDREGVAYHLVHESNIAWHAGESEWKGKSNVNEFSVGIELVNANDGIQEYPEAQLAACAALIKPMLADYGVTLEDVVGHLDIAPGRKTDPAGFDFDAFRKRLA